MRNFLEKIIRYIRIERQWRLGLLLIVLTWLVIQLEIRMIIHKQLEMNLLQSKKDLILTIPQFENTLALRAAAEAELKRRQEEALRLKKEEEERLKRQAQMKNETVPVHVPKKEFELPIPVLEGIVTIDGANAALIEGSIYEQGQNLGQYSVMTVTEDEVKLYDKKNKKVINLKTFDITDKIKIKRE